MNVYRLLRFFLPLQNPMGFGLSDFLVLGVAALVVGAILGRRWIERALRAVAVRPRWAMALLAALPILLRLALLPHHPVPVPPTSHHLSSLLLAHTLPPFPLSNPV